MEEQIEKTRVDMDRLVEDLKVVVRDSQELLKLRMEQLKSKAMEGARTTERAVRENPYGSLSIVFGVGVIVGIMAAGMCSRSDD
jgi:ElaB/YqjD/DUF883 family membrane-anchored ribosome-binding protein